MSAVDFPDSPANNQTFTVGDYTYRYNEPKNKWDVVASVILDQDLSQVSVSVIPSANVTYDLGTADKRWKDLYLSGNTIHLGDTILSTDDDGALQTTRNDVTIPIGGGTQVYANTASLPSAQDSLTGDMAYVTDNNRLYIFTGSVWYAILTTSTTNQSPSITSRDPYGRYILDGSGGSNTVIEIVATDPEEGELSFSYVISSGSLGNTTITQANNIFTIEPSSSEADAGDFQLTFSVTDGLNVVNRTSLFSLKFTYDWTTLGTQIDNFVAANTTTSSYFGYRTAMDSYNLCVTASNETGDGGNGEGCVFIYDILDTNNITQSQIFKAPVAGMNDWGDNMVLQANTLVIGAPSFDGSVDNVGRVYVYRRGSDGLFEEHQTIDGTVLSSALGKDVWLSDDGLKLFAIQDYNPDSESVDAIGSVKYYSRTDTESQFTFVHDIVANGIEDYDSPVTVRYNDEHDEVFLGYPYADSAATGGYTDPGYIFIFEFDTLTNEYNQKQVIRGYGSWSMPNTYTYDRSENYSSQYFGKRIGVRGNFLISGRWQRYDQTYEFDVIFKRDPNDGYYKYIATNQPSLNTAGQTDHQNSNNWGVESWEDDDYVYFGSGMRNMQSSRGCISIWKCSKSAGTAAFTLNMFVSGYYSSGAGSSHQVDPYRGIMAIGADYDDQSGISNRGRVYLYDWS